MADDVSEQTDLKNQYSSQVATDLENNAAEQERIGEEITTLQVRLQDLERDHSLLETMQNALVSTAGQGSAATSAAPTSAPTAAPRSARLPKARKPSGASESPSAKAAKPVKETAKAGPAKESKDTEGAAAKPAKESGKKAAAKSAAAKKSTATAAPTLRELVSEQLATAGEPRSAAEVTNALATLHPDRSASPTVVRNTLEALVAKGRAHRSKQQKSVFYSAVSGSKGTEGQDDSSES